MSNLDILLTPFTAAGITFRNRIVSTSHASGYAEAGMPGERYIRYHEEKAKGGAAMTMFGGSSIVSPDIAPIYGQIDVSRDAVIPHFQRFAQRIHAHGAHLTCQISHMGRRTGWNLGDWITPIGPSAVRDPAHHAVPRAMEIEDIERVITDYGVAAARCAEGGLDGVEILISSHLPGQFLSLDANRREDEYGGSIENRCRFLERILKEVRARTPKGFLLSLRTAVDESREGGPDLTETIVLAKRLYTAGLYDLLNLNGTGAASTRGLSELIAGMNAPLGPFLDIVRRFRAEVGVPVIHAGRIADVSTAAHAIESGAADLVGMTRAHFADPQIVAKLKEGGADRIRPCVGAAYCIDRIYSGRDALCLHNPATGRELTLPQTVEKSTSPRRRVVVVGGGPAGLEAARVTALRGHAVTLFEASGRLGGQVLLAARSGWRRDLIGIVDWLSAEVEHLGVDIRFETLAEAEEVRALSPDVVFVATGGTPRMAEVPGGAHALSTSEVLEKSEPPASPALIIDEGGSHAAISLADHLCTLGLEVEIVTPDRMVGRELGGSTYPVYLGNFARRGVRLTTDRRLIGISREGNHYRATLRHEYGDGIETRDVATIVAELGTEPNDGIYHALKAGSRNKGATDAAALRENRPQPALAMASSNGPALFLIGDAAASRDVHAAILDALRIAKDV
ncbi:MAG: FAD-dependent oxidoreductase [Hyphomicrobiaceae bacterium]